MVVVLVFKLIRRPAGAVRGGGAGAAAGASMGGKHGAMMSMGAFSPARRGVPLQLEKLRQK